LLVCISTSVDFPDPPFSAPIFTEIGKLVVLSVRESEVLKVPRMAPFVVWTFMESALTPYWDSASVKAKDLRGEPNTSTLTGLSEVVRAKWPKRNAIKSPMAKANIGTSARKDGI